MSAAKAVLEQVLFRAYVDGRSDRERGQPARSDEKLWKSARARGRVLMLPQTPQRELLLALREEYNVGRMAAEWSDNTA